ncbi:MAG: hypothetical protein M1813_009495 [Trichoglossum hirsutum]|nr:MAG: hypothetical protein M1813_009495 [Trichoglossum hirsutum]
MYRSLMSIRLILLALVLFPVAFADKIEDALHKRQSAPSGTGSSPSPTTSAATSTPPSTSSTPPASTSISSSSVTSSASPNPAPTPTSTAPTPIVPSSTVTSPQSTPSTTATPTIVVSAFTSSATRQVVTTVVSIDGGVTMSQVLTTDALVAVATSLTTSTSAPGLGSNGGSSGSSGPNSQQKKIIIGVVVGVGGFIILGGMALVAWRVWGRKKQPSDFSDLHAPSPKVQPGPGGPSPFQSTLDQYHNPGTVNTASNF